MTTSDEMPRWPDGSTAMGAVYLEPPTPCAPPTGASAAWKEGVERFGAAFVVLHGRSSHDPRVLRRYAAAVLAAAEEMERGRR